MSLGADRVAATLAALIAASTGGCGAAPWSQATFESGASSIVKSAEATHPDGAASNLIWLDFDAERGGWFIFDTGAAVAVIDDDFANALGLEAAGSVRVNGTPATLRKAPPLRIGAMRVADPLFVALDLDPLLGGPETGFGDSHQVAGIVGYALLKNAVVRIEYLPGEDEIYLADPSSYRLPDDEHWSPLRLEDRAPAMTATVSGAQGLFKLDTGKTFAASFSRDFVAAHRLDRGVALKMSENRRIEGPVEEAEAQVAYVELAGVRIERPTVGFRQGVEESDSSLDGVIGREILKRFTITFDYPDDRIALRPGGA